MNSEWQKYIVQAREHALWPGLGDWLEQHLESFLHRGGLLENYYLPLFLYLYELVLQSDQATFVIGINAPQGGGKSTLTACMVDLFARCGRNAVTLSIDDFYLTRTEQIALGRSNPDNPYLQQRGYPGTHDIALGTDILTKLKHPGSTDALSLPAYDKSRHAGQGDRTEPHLWPTVQLPIDVVMLEGWMLGFLPLPAGQINDRSLAGINTLLEGYKEWYGFLDTFVYLCPEDPGFVVDWRSEAEERMKARGLAGMSLAEIHAYAKKFLPAYQLYGPQLAVNPPTPHSFLNLIVGKNRLPAGL